MPNPGSDTLFDGDLVVYWVYDPTRSQLTCTATYRLQPFGSPSVLTPAQPTGHIQGNVDGHLVGVGLQADFTTLHLAIAATQTNPSRQQAGGGSF